MDSNHFRLPPLPTLLSKKKILDDQNNVKIYKFKLSVKVQSQGLPQLIHFKENFTEIH